MFYNDLIDLQNCRMCLTESKIHEEKLNCNHKIFRMRIESTKILRSIHIYDTYINKEKSF